MNNDQKNTLKEAILLRNNLYEFQSDRLKRLTMDPVRTFTYYVLQYLAYIKPYKVTKKTLWGDTMSYYLPEGGMVYYYGFWEANLTNFFVNFFKEGDVFFDIGAHVGYYSILASNLIGTTGKVISFLSDLLSAILLSAGTLFWAWYHIWQKPPCYYDVCPAHLQAVVFFPVLIKAHPMQQSVSHVSAAVAI